MVSIQLFFFFIQKIDVYNSITVRDGGGVFELILERVEKIFGKKIKKNNQRPKKKKFNASKNFSFYKRVSRRPVGPMLKKNEIFL